MEKGNWYILPLNFRNLSILSYFFWYEYFLLYDFCYELEMENSVRFVDWEFFVNPGLVPKHPHSSQKLWQKKESKNWSKLYGKFLFEISKFRQVSCDSMVKEKTINSLFFYFPCFSFPSTNSCGFWPNFP